MLQGCKFNNKTNVDLKCNNLIMWYKIKKIYLIAKKYSNKNNIKYDFYIRCRYDNLFINYKFDKNKLLNNKNTVFFAILA